jgi:hypothetical protein
MHKFRASYTVLSIWNSGDWQRAIKMYFKLEQFTTQAMADGRDWHEKFAEEIRRTNRMPAVFGGALLKSPIVEEKKVVQVEDWLELVYIMDLYDQPVLYDWKTGSKTSEEYAGEMQLRLYAVGATLSGHYVNRGEIHRLNPKNFTLVPMPEGEPTKKYHTDMSIVWLTDKVLADTHNWLITTASEMHNYLVENGLYERFAGRVTNG